MSRHRPPHPLVLAYSAHRRHVIDGLLVAALALPVAAVYAAAVDVAPDGTRAASSPAAVELREPTGHGGPIGPLALPSPAAGLPVWSEDKGAVVVDGQPLPAPAPVTTAPTEEAPSSTTAPSSSTVDAATAAEEDPQPATGLLALVNADRAEAGCGPVTIADDLTSQAQTHSNAQAAADSMFHSSSVAGYDSWGENVAIGYDDEAETHAAWMASEGHRANILNCTFGVIGWASADGASGRYWTESFAA